jgi:small conductance mechanosensitive channel
MMSHLLALPTLVLGQADDAAEEANVADQLATSEVAEAATSIWGKIVAGDFDAITTAEIMGVLLPIGQAIVLILLVLLVAGWARRLVTSAATRAKVEITLAKFFGAIVKWAILLLGAITVLQTFGIQATSFAAVLAGLTVGIGLALSGTLGNVASGVMLLIFRPFKVGDVVSVAGVVGSVDEIGLFTTSVDTPDKRRIILPNNSIVGAIIENISHHDTRRVDVAVGVDYGASIDDTRKVLEKAAASIPQGLGDPAPAIVLLDLGDSAVNWAVRLWVNAGDYWPVKDALTRAVKVHLDEAGIGIPFPQMDVHLDGKVDRGG